MANNSPFWYKIASYWHQNINPHGGPTIPFLLGVQHLDEFKSQPSYKTNIVALLSEMKSYNAPQPVYLKICSDIKEYVVSLYHKNYGDPENWGVKSEGHLLIDKEVIDRCSTFVNIISDVIENYNGYISKGRFSLNNDWPREWDSYSNKDLDILHSALL
jgi:hypothetical protein